MNNFQFSLLSTDFLGNSIKNIFEMRASGISPNHIADKLNEEGVPIP